MTTTTYRDLSLPNIENNLSKYNFDYPLCADILDTANYYPPNQGGYFLATYGHRYLSSTSGKTDNHGGFDYWYDVTCDGVTYSSSNPTAIICMCDGYISDIINGPDSVMELTGTGRSVQVACDSLPQAMNGNFKINYRHLSALGPMAILADSASPNTIYINKGDTIGIMGASGFTSNVHLHLSVQANHPANGNSFIHTTRVFDPTLYPNVLTTLSDAKVELLHDWPDSTLFRVIWPYNQTINRFEFSNGNFNAVFDKEAAYDTGSALRDEHDCVAGFKVFAYQFNGKLTAKARYDNEKSNMPAVYPASPQRDTAATGYGPVPVLYDSVAFVYDIMVENLPSNHDKDSFTVRLSDVWGYTVEATVPVFSKVQTIEEMKHNVKLFPNPTSGLVALHFNGEQKRSITVLNAQGQEVLQKQCFESKTQINLSAVPAGIYFVRIQTNDTLELLKVIKS